MRSVGKLCTVLCTTCGQLGRRCGHAGGDAKKRRGGSGPGGDRAAARTSQLAPHARARPAEAGGWECSWTVADQDAGGRVGQRAAPSLSARGSADHVSLCGAPFGWGTGRPRAALPSVRWQRSHGHTGRHAVPAGRARRDRARASPRVTLRSSREPRLGVHAWRAGIGGSRDGGAGPAPDRASRLWPGPPAGDDRLRGAPKGGAGVMRVRTRPWPASCAVPTRGGRESRVLPRPATAAGASTACCAVRGVSASRRPSRWAVCAARGPRPARPTGAGGPGVPGGSATPRSGAAGARAARTATSGGAGRACLARARRLRRLDGPACGARVACTRCARTLRQTPVAGDRAAGRAPSDRGPRTPRQPPWFPPSVGT